MSTAASLKLFGEIEVHLASLESYVESLEALAKSHRDSNNIPVGEEGQLTQLFGTQQNPYPLGQVLATKHAGEYASTIAALNALHLGLACTELTLKRLEVHKEDPLPREWDQFIEREIEPSGIFDRKAFRARQGKSIDIPAAKRLMGLPDIVEINSE